MPNNTFAQTGFFADGLELKHTTNGTPFVRQKVFFNGYHYQGQNDEKKGNIAFEATVEYRGQLATNLINYAKKHTKTLDDGTVVNTNGKGMPLFHIGVLETKSFQGDNGEKVKYNLLHGKQWRSNQVVVVSYSITFSGEVVPEYKAKEGTDQKELIIDATVYLNQSLYQNDKKNRSIGPINVRFRNGSATFVKNAAEKHTKKDEHNNVVKTKGKGMVLDAIAILFEDDWSNNEGNLVVQQRIEIIDVNYPSFVPRSNNRNSNNQNSHNNQSGNSYQNRNNNSNQSDNSSSQKQETNSQPKPEPKPLPKEELELDIDIDTDIELDEDPFGIDDDLGDLDFVDDDPLELDETVKSTLSK